LGQKKVELKHEAEFTVADGSEVDVVELVQVLAVELDGAAAWAIQCADDLEEGAFAGAGRTNDGEGLSAFDLERDVVEDGQGICAGR
jgi:hypothetical protein